MNKHKTLISIALVVIIIIFSVTAKLFPDFVDSFTTAFSKAANANSLERNADNYVVFFDDANGGCSLVCTKDHYFMINSGNKNTAANMINKLKELKITKLDFIIFTNTLSRDCEGLSQITKQIDTDLIFVSGTSRDENNADNDYLNSLISLSEKSKIPVRYLDKKESFSFYDANLTVFPNVNEYKYSSDRSTVIKLAIDRKTILFANKISSDREAEIHEQNITSDIFFLSGGFYSDCITQNFIESVAPETVIFTARNGSDSEVTNKISNRFLEYGARLLKTDIFGSITYYTNKNLFDSTNSRQELLN